MEKSSSFPSSSSSSKNSPLLKPYHLSSSSTTLGKSSSFSFPLDPVVADSIFENQHDREREEEGGHNKDSDIGGGKTIDWFGSVSLLVNNVTGAGMVFFVCMFQQSGWLLSTLLILFLAVISGISSFMLCECMSFMRNNGQFQRRVEYSTVMRHYVSHPSFLVIAAFYQLSLTVLNISLIVQSVQIMDFALIAMFGKTCLFPEIAPDFFRFHCPTPPSSSESTTALPPDSYAITAGLYATAILCIPLGFWNLDDNIIVQKVAFLILMGIVGIWCFFSLNQPVIDLDWVPTIGASFTNMVGISIFNFAFLTSIPSWVNEKKKDVSVHWSISISLLVSACVFIALGWIAGLAFPPVTFNNSGTLLTAIQSLHSAFANVTYYLFPVVANLTSIPVTAIFQRYNLVEEKLAPKWAANFFAIIVPWIVAIPLYQSVWYADLVNWSGVVITSTVNFIIPPYVYMLALKEKEVQHQLLLQEKEKQLQMESVTDVQTLQNGFGNHHRSYSDRISEKEDTLMMEGEDKYIEEEEVDETDMVERDEDGYPRWHCVPHRLAKWRWPVTIIVTSSMAILAGIALAQQIQSSIRGSG